MDQKSEQISYNIRSNVRSSFFHIITRYHRQLEVVPSHHREPESAEREPEKAREREREPERKPEREPERVRAKEREPNRARERARKRTKERAREREPERESQRESEREPDIQPVVCCKHIKLRYCMSQFFAKRWNTLYSTRKS